MEKDSRGRIRIAVRTRSGEVEVDPDQVRQAPKAKARLDGEAPATKAPEADLVDSMRTQVHPDTGPDLPAAVTQRARPLSVPEGSSVAANVDADGYWTAERTALHEEILTKALDVEKGLERPDLIMMGGGPASGKGTIQGNPAKGYTSYIDTPDSYVHIDADEFKGQLPDYIEKVDARDRGAASYAHVESSGLTSQALELGLKQRSNVLLDGVGNSSLKKMETKLLKAKEDGYRTVGHYVTVPVETALERAEARGERTGRYVPADVITNSHRNVSDVVPQLLERGLFDEFDLWDTDVEVGEPPKLIVSAKGPDYTIHDPEAWQRFLDKGTVNQEAGLVTEEIGAKGGFTGRSTSDEMGIGLDQPTTGFAVSMPEHNVTIDAVTAKDPIAVQAAVKDYMREKAPVLAENDQLYMGAWIDDETGELHLDITLVMPDKDSSVAMAKSWGQIAAWDLSANTALPTGNRPPADGSFDMRGRGFKADFADEEFTAQLSDVLSQMDQLHGVPDGRGVLVYRTELAWGLGGDYDFDENRLRINTVETTPEDQLITLVHELGHMWDFTPYEGSNADPQSRVQSELYSFQAPAGQRLMEAVFESPSYQALDAEDVSYRHYLQDPREIWARAYTQWYATTVGGDTLKAFEQAHPDRDKHWTDEEFETIGPLVEETIGAWSLGGGV